MTLLLICVFSLDVKSSEQSVKHSRGLYQYSKTHLIPTMTNGFDLAGLGILGAGAALGLFSHRYDRKVQQFFNEKPRLGSKLASFGNSFGTRYINVAIAGIQMIWDPSNGLAHLEGLLGTTLMITALKQSINRTRPNGENENSFPSGHTSTSFTSSGSLSYAYGTKVSILAYSLSLLTFLARLEDNKHWLSDLVVATSIGIFWGRASGIHHNYLSPIILKKGGGVRFALSF